MELNVRHSNRFCCVEYDAKPTAAKLRRQILREEGVASDFSVLTAPAPAHNRTAFKVLGNERELLIGIALFDTMDCLSPRGADAAADEVEIMFDPLNDGVGWLQCYFGVAYKGSADPADSSAHRDRQSTDDVTITTHAPYPAAHSTAYPELKLRKWQVRDEPFSICPITRLRCCWLFAWFKTSDVFRNGDVCGLNIARNRLPLAEFSSWNYCAGNGSQDAGSLGRLYRSRPPAHLHEVAAELDGQTLRLTGHLTGGADDFTLELADPLDARTPVPVNITDDAWQAAVRIDTNVTGRYRLYPACSGAPIEPRYVSIDIPSPTAARAFILSVTYDSPMSLIANHYTPERLDRDMRTWAKLGMRRVHWIEYANWPSFWGRAVYDWVKQYRATIEHCGDYLTAAARAAHDNDLEIIADLKTFDLGMNCSVAPRDGLSTVKDLEGRHVTVIPEIAAHPEWTMQSNVAWRPKRCGAITKLRLYSESPLPELRRRDVRLLVSRNNRQYTRYTGRVTFTQGTTRRSHQRWTPAGNVPDKGARRNAYIELSGLNIDEPFVAVELGAGEVALRHRGHALAEAWDASGRLAPLTVATNGTAASGFFFWKGWQGWTNQNEALLQPRKFDGANIGLVFREATNMPTMLEPAYEGARQIWLDRIATILDTGVDGVDIRTYCHHNGPMCYLQYAFAPAVCEAFRSIHGREPRCDADDYQRVRRIRGDFYTQFIRDARKLTADRGRKLTVQLESGIEVPDHLDCRMQIRLDWRTWITEGLVDEVRLKWFTAESAFVHEQVMPLARQHGVPVHLISRCLHTGMDIRWYEMADRLIGGAATAGFDGYNFYEQQNLMDLNPEGVTTLKGPTAPFMHRAREMLGQSEEG